LKTGHKKERKELKKSRVIQALTCPDLEKSSTGPFILVCNVDTILKKALFSFFQTNTLFFSPFAAQP
jgi:hypothetical protein